MSRSDRLFGLAVAAVALAWGWPNLDSGYEGPYDEGNTLCTAWRVAGGEIPYRDFWLIHPPGTAWLLAGVFRLFGTTVGVERATKLAVGVLAAVFVFFLARRSSRPAAAAAAAILFVALPTQTLSLRSRDTGLLLVLATLAVAGRAVPSGDPRRSSLAVGLLGGLTAWFKQDFAVAAMAAGAIPLLLLAARGTTWRQKSRAAARGAVVPLLLGAAAAYLVLLAILGGSGSLAAFFRQAVVFPAESFARVRGLSLSVRLEDLRGALEADLGYRTAVTAGAVPLLFLVALVAGMAAVVAGVLALRRGSSVRESAALISAGFAALLLLNAPRVRADLEHLNPALAPGLAALAALLAPKAPLAWARSGTTLSALALGVVVVVSLPPLASRAREVRRWASATPGGEGTTGLPAAPRWIGLDEDVVATARFVASSSLAGERIFVGNGRHDALAYNAPLIYFLAGRKGTTRYDNLHPGVATTRPVQEEIVRTLEESGTRWVVLWDGPPLTEPNDSAVSTGVFALDGWLAGGFREAARFGSFRVCERIQTSAALKPAR